MKKFITIVAVVAVLFSAMSCSTSMHDATLALPVKLALSPTAQPAGITISMVEKTGTMMKFTFDIVGIAPLTGTKLTIVGADLALTDGGQTVNFDEKNEEFTKTVVDGEVSFVVYTSAKPDWNGDVPAFKIVKFGTWDGVVEGVGGNIQITGSADKDVVIVIDGMKL